MALPHHLPPVEPPPELLAPFESPGPIPKAVRQAADFFVFFARILFPLLEAHRP